MCGRYRRTTKEEELARIYSIPIPEQPDLPVSYNIAPTQDVLAIRFNPVRRNGIPSCERVPIVLQSHGRILVGARQHVLHSEMFLSGDLEAPRILESIGTSHVVGRRAKAFV